MAVRAFCCDNGQGPIKWVWDGEVGYWLNHDGSVERSKLTPTTVHATSEYRLPYAKRLWSRVRKRLKAKGRK